MLENTVPSIASHSDSALTTSIPRVLLDMAIAFAPLLTLGLLGEWLGDGTALGAVFINLAYVLSLILATVVLKQRSSGWRQIGLARPKSWPKTVLLGFGTMVAAILVSTMVQAIIQILPGLEIAAADKSSYDALIGNLPLLILYLVAAWTIIVFAEEMVFRAFLINSLVTLFPNTRIRWALALLGSSLFFGLAHFSWGFAGVVDTMIFGLVFGFAYLRTGRNLWVPIITHGLMNTLAFVLIYLGYAV
jgi:membrane protease YdiL (CAAX protease family)